MDRDEMTELTGLDDELERRLAAYAQSRLALRPGASSRMRAAVHAHTRVADDRLRPSAVSTPGASRRTMRPLLALLAASIGLLAVAGGAFALSGPGQPFYAVRLWVEDATLPTEPAARAQALERQLDARLEEARAAAETGDPSAVAAALRAYREELASIVAAGGAIDLEVRLTNHLVVLRTLAGQVPESAQDAIAQAIERSGRALEQLQAGEGPGVGPGGGGQGGGGQGGGGQGGSGGSSSGGQGGGGQGGSGGPSGGGQSHEPGKPSPKPDPSPRPDPSPKPDEPKGSDKGADPSPTR